MEKLAHSLSCRIATQFNYDEDKKAVIEYGLIALFQLLAIAVIISLIGIMGYFLYESLIIFVGVGLLKKSTGGAHSQTMFGCMIISIFSISFFSFISRYTLNIPINQYLNSAISIVIFIFCFILFNKYVPLDSPNKPITKPEKIKRLRQQSFILLAILTLLTIFLSFVSQYNSRWFSIIISIRFILLWQAFMLSKSGIKFIRKIDSKFELKEV